MSNGTVDPRWPRLLSLTVHEFRTPMTVVAGYLRMLLKDRAGPITEQQRRLLEEAEKSCTRLVGAPGRGQRPRQPRGRNGYVNKSSRGTAAAHRRGHRHAPCHARSGAVGGAPGRREPFERRGRSDETADGVCIRPQRAAARARDEHAPVRPRRLADDSTGARMRGSRLPTRIGSSASHSPTTRPWRPSTSGGAAAA